ISAQQVNLAFAFATRARLVRRYGTPVEFEGTTVYAFPAPAALAAAPESELRAMQFSERKAEYIVGLARELATGRLDLAALAAGSDDPTCARPTTSACGGPSRLSATGVANGTARRSGGARAPGGPTGAWPP